MSQIVKQLLFLVIVCSFIGGGIYFILKNFHTDTQVLTLVDTVQVSAIKNRDDSARIHEGVFLLNKEPFEADVSNTIQKNPAFKGRDLKIDFDYLKDKNQFGIKGIRVFVLVDSDPIQATYWISSPIE